ncbi:unnamed protein product [Closterium sp. NIES-53]
MEMLNDAERSAMGAADAVKQLLDALRGHLKEVTSNTLAHVEVERDAATRLQGAATATPQCTSQGVEPQSG